MSCNGCRVLRKGCGESCILRPCLQWIERPEAQGNATVFVAKFFGRSSLMSFISSVPVTQRPALFKSLLFEACGRTINPVSGAVGLLWTDNWHLCQTAVETVLREGMLRQKTEMSGATDPNGLFADAMFFDTEGDGELLFCSATKRRKRALSIDRMPPPPCDRSSVPAATGKPSPGTPSIVSDESVNIVDEDRHEHLPRLMNLFV